MIPASLKDYLQPRVSLDRFCTLRAGGVAEWLGESRTIDELATISLECQQNGIQLTVLGGGSNVLPSDLGVPGVVVHNATSSYEIADDGEVLADSGMMFQELFLKTVQAGFAGFDYAVGIPGSIGGALLSNAGAYRSNISEFLEALEIVTEGTRQWVSPDWMEFAYRDSKLRRPDAPPTTVLRLKLRLPRASSAKDCYDEAREYQRQRISKQPPPASAGSFFKNVNDQALAQSLENLPERLKSAGVVPAGYLIENVGLAGHRVGGAAFASRHANFVVNIGNATATDIWNLAQLAKQRVNEKYGAQLSEEVLYIGDWTNVPHN